MRRAPRHGKRGKRAQHRRMGMEHVRPPFVDDPRDPLGPSAHRLPFPIGSKAAVARFPHAAERQAVHLFLVRAVGGMPDAGHAHDLPAEALLCFQDRARAEGVAAVEWQAVVEDVEDPRHVAHAFRRKGLTPPQPRPGYRWNGNGNRLPMIDNFSLLVSHGLVLIVFWRLLFRRDLDREGPEQRPDIIGRTAREERHDA